MNRRSNLAGESELFAKLRDAGVVLTTPNDGFETGRQMLAENRLREAVLCEIIFIKKKLTLPGEFDPTEAVIVMLRAAKFVPEEQRNVVNLLETLVDLPFDPKDAFNVACMEFFVHISDTSKATAFFEQNFDNVTDVEAKIQMSESRQVCAERGGDKMTLLRMLVKEIDIMMVNGCDRNRIAQKVGDFARHRKGVESIAFWQRHCIYAMFLCDGSFAKFAPHLRMIVDSEKCVPDDEDREMMLENICIAYRALFMVTKDNGLLTRMEDADVAYFSSPKKKTLAQFVRFVQFYLFSNAPERIFNVAHKHFMNLPKKSVACAQLTTTDLFTFFLPIATPKDVMEEKLWPFVFIGEPKISPQDSNMWDSLADSSSSEFFGMSHANIENIKSLRRILRDNIMCDSIVQAMERMLVDPSSLSLVPSEPSTKRMIDVMHILRAKNAPKSTTVLDKIAPQNEIVRTHETVSQKKRKSVTSQVSSLSSEDERGSSDKKVMSKRTSVKGLVNSMSLSDSESDKEPKRRIMIDDSDDPDVLFDRLERQLQSQSSSPESDSEELSDSDDLNEQLDRLERQLQSQSSSPESDSEFDDRESLDSCLADEQIEQAQVPSHDGDWASENQNSETSPEDIDNEEAVEEDEQRKCDVSSSFSFSSESDEESMDDSAVREEEHVPVYEEPICVETDVVEEPMVDNVSSPKSESEREKEDEQTEDSSAAIISEHDDEPARIHKELVEEVVEKNMKPEPAAEEHQESETSSESDEEHSNEPVTKEEAPAHEELAGVQEDLKEEPSKDASSSSESDDEQGKEPVDEIASQDEPAQEEAVEEHAEPEPVPVAEEQKTSLSTESDEEEEHVKDPAAKEEAPVHEEHAEDASSSSSSEPEVDGDKKDAEEAEHADEPIMEATPQEEEKPVGLVEDVAIEETEPERAFEEEKKSETSSESDEDEEHVKDPAAKEEEPAHVHEELADVQEDLKEEPAKDASSSSSSESDYEQTREPSEEIASQEEPAQEEAVGEHAEPEPAPVAEEHKESETSSESDEEQAEAAFEKEEEEPATVHEEPSDVQEDMEEEHAKEPAAKEEYELAQEEAVEEHAEPEPAPVSEEQDSETSSESDEEHAKEPAAKEAEEPAPVDEEPSDVQEDMEEEPAKDASSFSSSESDDVQGKDPVDESASRDEPTQEEAVEEHAEPEPVPAAEMQKESETSSESDEEHAKEPASEKEEEPAPVDEEPSDVQDLEEEPAKDASSSSSSESEPEADSDQKDVVKAEHADEPIVEAAQTEEEKPVELVEEAVEEHAEPEPVPAAEMQKESETSSESDDEQVMEPAAKEEEELAPAHEESSSLQDDLKEEPVKDSSSESEPKPESESSTSLEHGHVCDNSHVTPEESVEEDSDDEPTVVNSASVRLFASIICRDSDDDALPSHKPEEEDNKDAEVAPIVEERPEPAIVVAPSEEQTSSEKARGTPPLIQSVSEDESPTLLEQSSEMQLPTQTNEKNIQPLSSSRTNDGNDIEPSALLRSESSDMIEISPTEKSVLSRARGGLKSRNSVSAILSSSGGLSIDSVGKKLRKSRKGLSKSRSGVLRASRRNNDLGVSNTHMEYQFGCDEEEILFVGDDVSEDSEYIDDESEDSEFVDEGSSDYEQDGEDEFMFGYTDSESDSSLIGD